MALLEHVYNLSYRSNLVNLVNDESSRFRIHDPGQDIKSLILLHNICWLCDTYQAEASAQSSHFDCQYDKSISDNAKKFPCIRRAGPVQVSMAFG